MTSRAEHPSIATMLMRTPTHYRRRGLCHFRIWISLCLERRRERRALARLDDRLLRDIGITPEDARQEARRPCWKA